MHATSVSAQHVAGSRIIAVGHYQPARSDETVTEMASAAAAKTLARSGLTIADIDLVVVATATALHRMPCTASHTR